MKMMISYIPYIRAYMKDHYDVVAFYTPNPNQKGYTINISVNVNLKNRIGILKLPI